MTKKNFARVSASLFMVVSLPLVARAQVREVVVGITPTCPYGLTGCWGGASEGLARLSGVASVGKSPEAGKAEKEGLPVFVTGALVYRDGSAALEVREFFPVKQQ